MANSPPPGPPPHDHLHVPDHGRTAFRQGPPVTGYGQVDVGGANPGRARSTMPVMSSEMANPHRMPMKPPTLISIKPL